MYDMPDAGWFQLLASSLGGGVVVKVLDYAHHEYTRHRDRRDVAKDLFAKHRDPLLKAADELVGRVRSMGRSDFRDFNGAEQPVSDLELTRKLASYFVFAQFWAQIQLLRIAAGTASLASDSTGERLQAFFEQLESHNVRIFDRTWQRATGEAILLADAGVRRSMNLYEFVKSYRADPSFAAWLSPLVELFGSTRDNKDARHRILRDGAVVHALADTLDPNHVLTRNDDGWPHKLPPTMRKKLFFGVFQKHLPFVKQAAKYASLETGRPAESGELTTQ
jgi:hypothetical protein